MKIDHCALYVDDLDGARDFFIQYFDGKPNELYHNPRTDFRSYFISFEDGSRLEIMNKPGLEHQNSTDARTGFIHLCFSLGSKEAVDSMANQLKEDGWNILSGPRTTGDGYYETLFEGPEGNLIEITA